MTSIKKPPTSEAELESRCQAIAGLTFSQLADSLQITIPEHQVQRKGWSGQLIELALGAHAQNLAMPDFPDLGIELKTLPIGHHGKPLESTFVTSINLLSVGTEQWQVSSTYQKLKRVLWVPVEGARDIHYSSRRIGKGFFWSPSMVEAASLQQDWQMFAEKIALGQINDIDSRAGDVLQIRPKAADGSVLCDAIDEHGTTIKTLPRGFYLRRLFTERLWADARSG